VIGSVVSFSGSFAFGGLGSTGLSGGGSAYASGASSRLLSGSALQSLGDSRASVAQIQAALTKLRDALVSARDNADAVPGRTTLKAVTAAIEQYVDKPTYVTIAGEPVQNGTVTVSQGAKQVVVGYERVNRSEIDIGEAVKVLIRATANVSAAAGINDSTVFIGDISAVLRSSELQGAVTRPDKASLDGALQQINGLLAKAEGFGFTVNARANAAAQIDLGGLLLGAAPNLLGGSSTATGSDGASAYQAAASSTTGTASGSAVKTVA
jgi:hypothetical protein